MFTVLGAGREFLRIVREEDYERRLALLKATLAARSDWLKKHPRWLNLFKSLLVSCAHILLEKSRGESDPDKRRKILELASRWGEEAVKALPASRWACNTTACIFRERFWLEPDVAQKIALLGRARQIHEAAEGRASENAYGCFHWGYILGLLAGYECDRDTRRDLLRSARAKYERGAALKPEDKGFLAQWSHALLSLADLEDEESVMVECYELVLDISGRAEPEVPGNAWVLEHQRMALAKLATMVRDKKGGEKILDEVRRYDEIMRAPVSGDGIAWFLWGVLSTSLAHWETDVAAKRKGYENACRGFEEAGRRMPWEVNGCRNWGMALFRLAELEADPVLKKGLLRAACAKFDKFLQGNPEDTDVWLRKGRALARMAALEEEPGGRQKYLSRVEASFQHADNIKYGSSFTRRACVAALQGKHDICRRWLEKAETAGTLPELEKLADEPDLESVKGDAWFEELLARHGRGQGRTECVHQKDREK